MSSRLGARFLLPFLGLAAVLLLWAVVSQTVAADLPSPWKTWLESKRYILEPFFKDGEMNQGIGRLAFYSLVRVAKGYLLALAIGTPIGFFLGLSRGFHSWLVSGARTKSWRRHLAPVWRAIPTAAFILCFLFRASRPRG